MTIIDESTPRAKEGTIISARPLERIAARGVIDQTL